MQKRSYKKLFTTISVLVLTAISISSCSGTKIKADGKLKKTDYCAFYREFEEKVPTAKPKEQQELLEKVAGAKDFPEEMRKDYELIIKAYKAIDEGKAVSKDEKKNEEAANRMNRHAIENCEILTSDNPSGGGV